MDATHTDVVDKVDDDWSLAGITTAMVKALRTRSQPVPPYLRLLATEAASRKRGVETAVFGMS